ncbi:chromosome segregation ATPase domain protein [Burkholderia pseudomallei MSHR303]|nr:chromosome segregation ATPase domain protein [Burkholderia pseudomallei MSHR303]
MIALLAEDNPIDADVDNDATLLLVVLNPVDSEPMPVDVEVDSDVIALLADDSPVDADVDSDVSCS